MKYAPSRRLRRKKSKPVATVTLLLLVAVAAVGVGLTVRAGAPGHIWPLSILHSAATPPSKNTGPVDAHALGIAAGSSLPSLDTVQLADRLDGIRATGARWVRLDFDWSAIQPSSPSAFDWSAYDRVVQAISARHLTILGILDYTPAWAQTPGCQGGSQCSPRDDAQFAAFAAAAAGRYGPQGVHDWEIWNEPNNPNFWQPSASPAQYVSLLRATYPALHHADTRAYVITGGLSPQATGNGAYAPYDFLAGVYRAGGQAYFDAVGDHPYTFPLSPTDPGYQAWTQMAGTSNSLRSLMVANGDSAKKIWITEFGAPTGGPGPVATIQNPNLAAKPYVVDEALQAKILTNALALYGTYPWAGPFFYYTYQDPGTDPSTNENFFGLVTAAGRQKQAYGVFRSAAAQYVSP